MDNKSALWTKLSSQAEFSNLIKPHFYDMYNVKRGLRNKNGTGVLVGLTEVGNVDGYDMISGIKKPKDGELYYRGINVRDLVKGFQADHRYGFEETVYLLLFGSLPDIGELNEFSQWLDMYRYLPEQFTENMILKIPSKDIMNKLMRSILVLYSHDENPDDTNVANVLSQSIRLIAQFPTIISYGYQAKRHYFDMESLFIHNPKTGVGTAENILHMIRPDNNYTAIEAETLDLCLVIHAEHGGGNNSTFATHVVSSSGTDTYSALSTAVGSLKGHKHGGANKRVRDMILDIRKNVPQWDNSKKLKSYLKKILQKQAYNKEGLIYGMGHAVYTKSDPRAVLLKEKARELAIEKNALDQLYLYEQIESLTKELFHELKGPDVEISANVDLYSGFVYEMLNIPYELYTPLFAVARVGGWCAHRIEQIVSDKKIIRPAFKNVKSPMAYVPLSSRSQFIPEKNIEGNLSV